MRFFAVFTDWLIQSILLFSLLLTTEARGDVILWGQGENSPPATNFPYIIKQNESRIQPFFYKDPFELREVRLHVQDNPLSSGTGRVTVWVNGESIYSGLAATRISGLSKRLNAGWHEVKVTGIENQSQWLGSAGNPVGSLFNNQPAPGLNMYISGMSLVPEPGAAILMAACFVGAGVYTWLKRR